MMDFQTFKSLAFAFGPFIASYAFSYYRNLKSQSRANAPARRPVPPAVKNALNLLFAGASLSFLLSLPVFAPENIIKFSASRLQTPSDVLWRRVEGLRPDAQLTALDTKLRERLTSIESRCLYLVYGPETLADCRFCNSNDPQSYLIYALPSLIIPHLWNIAALGLATSSALAGTAGNQWRMQATLAGFLLSVADIYLFYNYDHTKNARVLRPEKLTNFYWNMRLARYSGISALQLAFAGLLWLSSTNRLFVIPVTAKERLDRIRVRFDVVTTKLSGSRMIQNSVMGDQSIQSMQTAFWKQNSDVTREITAEDTVVHSIRAARSSGRVNLEQIERAARTCAEELVDEALVDAARLPQQ